MFAFQFAKSLTIGRERTPAVGLQILPELTASSVIPTAAEWMGILLHCFGCNRLCFLYFESKVCICNILQQISARNLLKMLDQREGGGYPLRYGAGTQNVHWAPASMENSGCRGETCERTRHNLPQERSERSPGVIYRPFRCRSLVLSIL